MNQAKIKPGDKVQGKIQTLAFGGSGILRLDNFVIFVPFTAPDDEIIAKITQVKKGFAFAEIDTFIKKSPLRTTPKCPYFGICKGCQLQHLKYDAQLESKRHAVSDALSRIGKMEFPPATITGSDQEYFYRERIELNIEAHEFEYKVGYMGKNGILEVDVCPIFIHLDNPIIKEVRTLIKKLDFIKSNEGRVQILKDKNKGFIVYIELKKIPKNADQIIQELKSELIVGIEIGNGDISSQKGSDTVISDVNGLKIEYSPQVFIQNNFSQSIHIYNEIIKLTKGKASVLDLYSGIGISSLLMMKEGISVTAIEQNLYSVALAKENALRNGMNPDAFIEGNVESLIETYLEQFDTVLINPPRQGLMKEVVEALVKFKPKEIIYISCMPSTLARDLKELNPYYSVNRVQAFDMFPQTGHIETLINLCSN